MFFNSTKNAKQLDSLSQRSLAVNFPKFQASNFVEKKIHKELTLLKLPSFLLIILHASPSCLSHTTRRSRGERAMSLSATPFDTEKSLYLCKS